MVILLLFDLETTSRIPWVIKRPRCFDWSTSSTDWSGDRCCSAEGSLDLSAVCNLTVCCIRTFFEAYL